jgi:hypothetical protein
MDRTRRAQELKFKGNRSMGRLKTIWLSLLLDDSKKRKIWQ